MTILDQPLVIEDETPRVTKWMAFEKIVPSIVFALTITREITGLLWTYEAIMMTTLLLGVGYLFAYYWIDKPATRSARTIVVSILYGISFFIASFAFILLILFMPGGRETSLLTLGVIIITVIIDIAWASRKQSVGSKHTIIRACLFALILGTLNLIPESTHVLSVYRKYPGFVAYYKEHQEDGKFMNILYDYTKLNNIPEGELR